jgi:S-methylmethionine-dependent homocysteine/selenocysteine methylase
MIKPLLDRLREGIVIGDGGYLLELEKRGYVKAGPYTPEVAIEHPEALRQLHREFLRAGAEVLQTCTFYASQEKQRGLRRRYRAHQSRRGPDRARSSTRRGAGRRESEPDVAILTGRSQR